MQKSTELAVPTQSLVEENKLIRDTIDLFRNVNETHSILFARPPQRNAAKRLLAQFGFEKVAIAVKYIESVADDKFAPIVTTPVQLEQKWGALRLHYLKNNAPGQRKGIDLDNL